MQLLTALTYLFLTHTDPGAAVPAQPVQETCAVVVSTDGEPVMVAMESLSVVELTSQPGAFALPADAPNYVVGVHCERESIVPASNDYKVLLAGLPLSISTTDERTAALESNQGRVQFRALEGEFADEEIPQISAYIDQAQLHFNASESAASVDGAVPDLPVEEATPPLSIDEALARTERLGEQLDFAGIKALLAPFAESGNAEVEFELANAYMNLAINGKQSEEIQLADIQPAIDLALRAGEHGIDNAYNLLYMIYGNGWGVPADKTKAAAYLHKAVAGGDDGAKLNYAISLYQGTNIIERDRDASCPLLLELREVPGFGEIAAYYLGLLVYRGECGGEPNPESGMKLIEVAAEHDVRLAQRDMGKNWEFGWVQPANLETALDWYQKAADKGDAYAQWRIGMSYVDGEMREVNAARAVEYFQHSAASEEPNGLISLAVMYATGDGIELDYSKARALYEKAALLGESHAYRALATMYHNGEGLEIDLVYSRLLYLQSLALGSGQAVPLENSYAEKMTPEQIEESDRQFQRWQALHPPKS